MVLVDSYFLTVHILFLFLFHFVLLDTHVVSCLSCFGRCVTMLRELHYVTTLYDYAVFWWCACGCVQRGGVHLTWIVMMVHLMWNSGVCRRSHWATG